MNCFREIVEEQLRIERHAPNSKQKNSAERKVRSINFLLVTKKNEWVLGKYFSCLGKIYTLCSPRLRGSENRTKLSIHQSSLILSRKCVLKFMPLLRFKFQLKTHFLFNVDIVKETLIVTSPFDSSEGSGSRRERKHL